MRKLAFVLCLAFPLAAGLRAQGKIDSHWTCGKATVEHSVEVGDQPGHAYVVSQGKCTATKGEIGGVKEVDGTGTEFHEVKGNRRTWQGFFIETLASGDKIHYSYKGVANTSGGRFVAGSNNWAIVGGTGKFAGATGGGVCKGRGNPDGTVTWECNGTYNPASAAPAKKN